MTLSAGEEFAGYTIVSPLGAGAMGEVYLAKHPRLPRREALKILRADISTDESFRQRFKREADSIADLEHPNIVTVHDRGNTDGRLWIATQYVDGADAAQLLRERHQGGMPADEVAAITASIASALDYAHGRGLLHRDVKPANILISHPDHDGNRRIYLADFGIARPLDDPAGLTATNFTFGTFAYAAPEQLMGKDIDGRADQYALAATAYHLLTGAPVYSDSNPVAVISHHLTEPPPAPSTIRPELAPFDTAFARALAKKPEDRFERCQDFARALTAAAEGSELGYPASAPTQQAPIPGAAAPTGRAGHAPKAALAAAVALFGLVAGALLWHPWTNTGPTPATPSTSTSPLAPSTTTTTTTATSSSTPPPAPPPPAPTSTAPPQPKYPRAGALGDGCSPPHAIGTAADGSLYYCEALQSTDVFEWAPTPGPIPNPNAPPPYTPPPAWQINANGPAPLTPCTTPGAVVPGTLGLMQCQPPLFTGGVWMWGVAPR